MSKSDRERERRRRSAEVARNRADVHRTLRGILSRIPNDPELKSFVRAAQVLIDTGLPNLAPLLPALLHLKGSPYSLHNHFCFEPFFSTMMARSMTLKTARQVSKSTSMAAQGVIISNCLPFFNTLFVTPLYEMIRRFSNNYVRGFIDQSPVKRLWTSTATSSNVLQRSFTNNSNMFFSFAFLDADRTRGLNCDKCGYDEVQDLDLDFIPIISETMSGSPYGGISQFTGTPKTMENALENLWQQSSMAEWVIPCLQPGCGYENVPALNHDLDKMIGPWHPDISEERPGCVCAKCGHSVFPRLGRWRHARPELIFERAGYHVPQIVMPMHYADRDKWSVLLEKQQTVAANVFYNEVCGESFDTGAKLVTLTDLKEAAILHKNKLETAVQSLPDYANTYTILSVDWGGGGEAGTSFTTYAIMVMTPDGKIDVIYGYRSLTPHDPYREAKIALHLAQKFNTRFIVHDWGSGAGGLREQFIVNAGFPLSRIVPIAYVPAAKQELMTYAAPSELRPRGVYQVDKARSLVLTCSQIRDRQIRFFQDDYVSKERPGVLRDFLALVEDKVDSPGGRDRYRIIRNPQLADDFAQSVNMGACTLWKVSKRWPNIAATSRFGLDAAAIESLQRHPWQDVLDGDV